MEMGGAAWVGVKFLLTWRITYAGGDVLREFVMEIPWGKHSLIIYLLCDAAGIFYSAPVLLIETWEYFVNNFFLN